MSYLANLRLVAVAAVLLAALGVPGAVSAADRSAASQAGQTSISVGSNPDGIAVDATTDTIYVANNGDDSVSVIDGAKAEVTSTIIVGAAPRGIAVDEKTDTIYVANSGDQTVSVIDGSTGKVTHTLTVGADPDAVAINEATNTIYVTWHNGIASIDGATDVVTPEAIDMPPVAGTGINDVLAEDSSTGDLYLVNWLIGFVSIIDMSTDQPVNHYDAGSAPGALAVDPLHRLLYVGSCESGFFSGVWVIDLTDGSTKAQISDGCPTAVAVDTRTGVGVSIDQSAGQLSFIGGAPYHVTGSLNVGLEPTSVAADSATGTIYVADETLAGHVIAVTPKAPQITSPSAATFTAGKRGSFQVTATGYPAVTYSESGQLPRGLTMSPTGLISGVPAANSGGTYNVTVSASNPVPIPATQKLTLTVRQAPALASASRVVFTTGRSKTFKIIATGFPAANITEKGSLPHGLHFKAHPNGTATIFGTPAKADRHGTYALTITATNGVGRSAVQHFRLILR